MLRYLLLMIPPATLVATYFSDNLSPFQKNCLRVAWGASMVIVLTYHEFTALPPAGAALGGY
jgi:hypothetical protein